MQIYFAAKAAGKLARWSKCPCHPRGVPQPLLYCPDRCLACSHNSSLEVRDGDTLHAHFPLLASGGLNKEAMHGVLGMAWFSRMTA
jgi:hypothetical protein